MDPQGDERGQDSRGATKPDRPVHATNASSCEPCEQKAHPRPGQPADEGANRPSAPAAEAKRDVSLRPRMTEKKTGVRKIPNNVTPTIPLNTAIPNDRRISEPAPDATTSGITPMMKANEVIRIGRSRNRHASSVASRRGSPSMCFCLAYSTIKMAFLHASPTSTTRPICTKILTSRPVLSTPATEQSRHIGTTRMTASGSDQLS